MVLDTGCPQNVAGNVKCDVIDSDIPILLGKNKKKSDI